MELDREIPPFFSIIIPVYNSECYIEKCINSVLQQSYREYEIIAVDDGSTDQSGVILDRYASNDSRIKVIHTSNGGIGAAIENGIKNAVGEYIVFIDSDDYIEKDMLKTLSDHACTSNFPDIIQFGLIYENEKGKVVGKEESKECFRKNNTDILKDYFEKRATPSLACRIFKRKLFDEASYIRQNVGIDEVLIVQLLNKAESFSGIEKYMYHVYLRPNSVSRQFFTEEVFALYKNAYDHLLMQINIKESFKAYIRMKYIEFLRLYYVKRDDNDDFEHDRAILEEFNDNYELVKYSREFNHRGRRYTVGMKLFAFSPKLYRRIKRLCMK